MDKHTRLLAMAESVLNEIAEENSHPQWQEYEPQYVVMQYKSGEGRVPRLVYAVIDKANYLRVSGEYAVHMHTSAHLKHHRLMHGDRYGHDLRSVRSVMTDYAALVKGGKPKVVVPLSRGAFLTMRNTNLLDEWLNMED